MREFLLFSRPLLTQSLFPFIYKKSALTKVIVSGKMFHAKRGVKKIYLAAIAGIATLIIFGGVRESL